MNFPNSLNGLRDFSPVHGCPSGAAAGFHGWALDYRDANRGSLRRSNAAVTKYLASPESRILALLARGVQARAHLQALRHVCRLDEIRVWSRTPDHAKRFAELHRAIAMDLERAVRGADVTVTETNSLEPFLKGEWPKEGAHVNAIGSPRPNLEGARR